MLDCGGAAAASRVARRCFVFFPLAALRFERSAPRTRADDIAQQLISAELHGWLRHLCMGLKTLLGIAFIPSALKPGGRPHTLGPGVPTHPASGGQNMYFNQK